MFRNMGIWAAGGLALLVHLAACGTDPGSAADGDADGDADVESLECSTPRYAVVTTTDYTTGGTALLDLDERTAETDLLTIHPDAVVRCSCGVTTVVERLGGDNLLLLDDEAEAPREQISLGRRTNPQDAWFDGDHAFVALHESGEVVVVDLSAGGVAERLDLTPYADADGHPEPAAIIGLGDRIYVALQLLDRSTALWDPAKTAEILVLRRDPLEVVDTIELVGSNPVTTFRPGPEPGTALLGHAGIWAEPFDGGIELIDLVAGESQGLIATGESLGGSVIDLVLVGEELGYATVNVASDQDRLISFDPSTGGQLETLASGPPYTLVRLVLDQQGGRNQLLVANRDSERPGVMFFDASTGEDLAGGPVPTGLPPFDLCPIPQLAGMGGGGGDGGVTDERTGQFIAEVTEFAPAEGVTFGADRFPEVVLGPPEGAGEDSGSVDVLSLGCGGTIVLRFDPPIADLPESPDFIVFENAFRSGDHLFAEPGLVSASADGEVFHEFACDPAAEPPAGCAGVTPVSSSSTNNIDPTDPALAGGDAFDLAELGLDEVTYVRIVDRSAESPSASMWCSAPNAGFDLDAISVVATSE